MPGCLVSVPVEECLASDESTLQSSVRPIIVPISSELPIV